MKNRKVDKEEKYNNESKHDTNTTQSRNYFGMTASAVWMIEKLLLISNVNNDGHREQAN